MKTVATGELLAIEEAIWSIRSRTLVCSLKLDLNPDCVSGRIPLLFETSRNLLRNKLSMIFKKVSKSEIGLVFETGQMASFFASSIILTSFQQEGKKHVLRDKLNNWTRSVQYWGDKNLNKNVERPCASHESFFSFFATTFNTSSIGWAMKH